MTKRAILYARVSSDDSQKEGRNLAGQLDMCRKYALDQDYSIVAELHEDDRGASGAAFELEQLNRVREMARAQAFDVLIVREIDRLSRSLAKQLIVEEELQRAGVKIEYVLGEYPDTPEGRLHKHIKATIAEYEREQIRERMTRGRELKVQTGSVMVHGRPAYGYRRQVEDGKFTLVIEEAEAHIVRMIFEWYTEGDGTGGGLSIRGIKNKLDEMHAPTYEDTRRVHKKERGFGEWSRGTIAKILANETYCGVWRYYRETTLDAALAVDVPAIVSRQTFERARQRREHNRSAVRHAPVFNCLLKGRLKCAHCGARLVANVPDPEKGRAYYVCPAKRKGEYSRPCPFGPRVRIIPVDDKVWQWVRSLLRDPQELMNGLAAHRDRQKDEYAPLWARIKVIDDLTRNQKTQLERLLDLYVRGDFAKELLVERRERIETSIRALEKEHRELEDFLNSRTLTDAQISDLQDFAQAVATGLATADKDFGARLHIIEALDVRGTIGIENGKKILYARCVLGESEGFIVNGNKDEEPARGATLVCHGLTVATSKVNP